MDSVKLSASSDSEVLHASLSGSDDLDEVTASGEKDEELLDEEELSRDRES